MQRRIGIILVGMGVLLSFPRSSNAQWMMAHRFELNGIECLATSGPNLFAGTSSSYGSGIVLLSTDNGSSWTSLNPKGWPQSRGNRPPKVTSVKCLVVSGPNLFAATDTGGVFLSTDNGASWTAGNSGLPQTESFRCLAASGTHLFAGGWKNFFISTDNGASWVVGNSGLPAGVSIECLAVSKQNVFAGNYYGVFRSTDNGTSWTAANSGLPAHAQVDCLAVSGKYLLAGTPGGLFRSVDNGASWTKVNLGLPAGSYGTCLAVSKQNVFAGTGEAGVFRSTDNGTSWTAINLGWLPKKIRVECLAVNDTQLFAGVYIADSGKYEVWRMPLTNVPIPGQETAQVYSNNGDRAYRDGDYANAVLYYSKAIKLDPTSVHALFQRAWSYLNLGGRSSYDSALADVTRILELSPTNRDVYFARGEIYRNLAYFSLDKGNRKEADAYLSKALADYQIALEANPNSPIIPVRIGDAHLAKGDLDKALVDYAKLLEKKPGDEEIEKDLNLVFEAYDKLNRELDCGSYKHTWQLAGKFQSDKKHYNQAIKCFSKALELGLTDWSVYTDRAFAYQWNGEFAKALADYTVAIKLDPSSSWYSMRASAYQGSGDLDKAIADYTTAIKLARKELKGITRSKEGTQEDAAYQAEYLLGLYFDRAYVFEKQQDWNEAIDDYETASDYLNPGPGKARILYRIGLAYQHKGDADKAQKYFQQAIAMDPNVKE